MKGSAFLNIKKLHSWGSERTIERYIQQLRDAKLIEFKGEAAQTGGYYLTKQLKEKLFLQ